MPQTLIGRSVSHMESRYNMANRCITSPDERKFEAFMEEQGVALQSVHWAAVKNNWERRLFALENSQGTIVAGAMVLVKPLPMGYSMYYIPRGPIAAGQNQELMIELLNAIRQESRKDKCIFIKFDPYILDHRFMLKEGRPEGHNQKAVDRFEKETGAIHKGYTMSIAETVQPRTNMGVDVTDDFTARYARNTRRAIKKAAKENLSAEIHTASDIRSNPEILDIFSELMHCTEDRKGVKLRDREYFQRIIDSFDGAIISLCRTSDGTCISGILSIGYNGKLEMLYMGNNNAYSKTGASAFLYDATYRYASEHGIRYCDMSGVEGSMEDGLSNHKHSLGADVREYIGEFDIPVKPLMYKMVLPVYEKKTGGA